MRRFGRYELLRHLASGGMARVYLARATGPGGFARHVVVKTIPDERRDDDQFVAMFLDEARLVAALNHQNIAQVFEVGVADDGTYFLVMEYVHGATVRQLLEAARKQRIKLPLEVSLSIACAAAAGLHHAHERRDASGTPLGIVHRDVSPSNVILGYDGSIKLIDFGIAKANLRTTQTATGFIKGKAGYMAPEQARGYAVDRRSDVFALGVLAYELTTQTRAFHAESQFESIRRTLHGDIEPPSLRMAEYPMALEDVVMTALELDPDDRFQDVEAMRVAFEQIARELGLGLGSAPVIRALEQLFPPRPEPWLLGGATYGDDDAPDASEPMIVIMPRTPSRPRLARGTEAHGTHVRSPEPVPERPLLDSIDLTTQPYERSLSPPSDPLYMHGGTDSTMPPARVTPVTASMPALPLPVERPAFGERLLPLPPVPEAHVPVEAPPVLAPPQLEATVPPMRASTLHVFVDRRRRSLTVAAATLAVLGISLIAYAITRDEPAVAKPPPVVQAPARRPPPPPPARPDPVAAAKHDGTVLLEVTTDPVGATVVLDGVRLGLAPLTLRIPARDSAAWLKVRKRGHAAVKTRVSLERDVRWDVQLRTLAR